MKGWTQAHIDRLNLKSSSSPVLKEKRSKKPKTIPQLVKDLDDIFSIWVRKANEDENGVIKCFTCGRLMTFKTAQNGHYIGRQYKAVRWSEINCQPQDYVCNILNEGEKVKFAAALDKKYGEGTAEKMNQQKNNRFKLERPILEILIQEYKTKVANL
jgi:hypothetical protein